MKITLRQEQKKDHKIVFQVVKQAFADMIHSNQSEHFLVEKLRKSDAFIPELSIVAEYDNQIVGHILLTKIQIKNEEQVFDALTLAPVSVLPTFHKQGIGSQLVLKAHEIAKKLGHSIVILLGHASYYPRFGYKKTSDFGIRLPFDVAEENAMLMALHPTALSGVSGTVVYSQPFLE